MLFDLDKKPVNSLAAIDDIGGQLTYGEIVQLCGIIDEKLSRRQLVFCLCENMVGSLAGFLSLYQNENVCLLLSAHIDKVLLDNLVKTYTPSYFWMPKSLNSEYEIVLEYKDFVLRKTCMCAPKMHSQLSLLMTTSGTTGSPKLVRHKYGNIEHNARNVASIFSWTSEEKGIIDLPMQYTMGLNVITSHLYSGACVLLLSSNLMSPKFWTFIKENKATNFTGVPFSYEILNKVKVYRMDLPYLRTLSEGGGKLSDILFAKFSNYAKENGKRFFATFGTTETSARLSYLHPEFASEKCGSIGNAIPEGKLYLVDDSGSIIFDTDTEGELVYEGPNVTMGYAESIEDLSKGDEFCGVYHTGDLAIKDKDNCYYIVGRKKRFLKLFGLRISLDQIERIIYDTLNIDSACSGNDMLMNVYIDKEDRCELVKQLIYERTGLSHTSYRVIFVNEIIRNESGKINYKELDRIYGLIKN